MNTNLERKQELEFALKQYLGQAEMHPFSSYRQLAKTGDYALVFGWSSFKKQCDPESYYFLVPEEAEQKLIEKVDNLFDSQIRAATIRNSLRGAMTVFGQEDEFIFPFENDKQEEQYHDRFYELLKSHYESRYDAFVPMYQVECAAGVEFPLASAVLHSGGVHSQLASIANNAEKNMNDAYREQIEHCSYLKFPVTGDPASRLEQVERETERALQVLRFIYPWLERDAKAYNPAHGVSMWKHSWRVLVYGCPHSEYLQRVIDGEIPNAIFGTHKLTSKFLKYAQEIGGLCDINFHIQNARSNYVSKRIVRALTFYDTASQSSDYQVAFSNFIISVDILLPAKNVSRSVLTGFLKSLIEHGKFYTGEMRLSDDLGDPETTPWPERVRLTTEDFEDFYRTRGQILHGNEEERYKVKISKLKVKKARQIAHNAIRAYAYLARSLNWQIDKVALKWFKSPHSPPKEANS